MLEIDDNILGLINTLDDPVENDLKQLRDIVPVEDWISSEYYVGSLKKDLWDYWKKVTIEFFTGQQKNLLILHGSLGGGKTHECLVIFVRLVYELSCWKYPQSRFGLSRKTPIILFYLVPNLKVGEMTGFGTLKNIFDSIPYFQENFPRDKNKNSYLDFANGTVQIHLGSDASHFIGSNLYSLILDEASFQRGAGGDVGKLQKAINIFRESTNRRKSRFTFEGVEYGVNMIASSADSITSFTEQEIERNIGNPEALIKQVKKYELTPENYSTEKFWVFKGDRQHDAFVVDRDNRLNYKNLLESFKIENADDFLHYIDYGDVQIPEYPEEFKRLFVNPPVDFYDTYKLDTINSLKEVDGVSVNSSLKFFTEMTKFSECIDNTIPMPFTKDKIVLSTGTSGNELIECLRPEIKGKDFNYYLRFDLSKTGDSTGFCMGHYDNDSGCAIIDMLLQIDPPMYPEKIDYTKILDFVLHLKNECNFAIKNISFDQYQSEFFLQYFNKRRMSTTLLSVDRGDEIYLFFKNKIIMNEIRFAYNPRLEFELMNLVYYISQKKIDHLEQKNKKASQGGYGKDLCDAISGCVYSIFMNEAVYDTQGTRGILEEMIKNKKEQHDLSYKSVLKMEEKLLGMKLLKI